MDAETVTSRARGTQRALAPQGGHDRVRQAAAPAQLRQRRALADERGHGVPAAAAVAPARVSKAGVFLECEGKSPRGCLFFPMNKRKTTIKKETRREKERKTSVSFRERRLLSNKMHMKMKRYTRGSALRERVLHALDEGQHLQFSKMNVRRTLNFQSAPLSCP